MTRAVMRRWHTDPGRVYAIGISAGGFETAILGAYYPDLYAAIGIHSGAPYRGAEPGCFPASESSADTNTLAGDALAAMGARARVMPVIVIHGDADPAGTPPRGAGLADRGPARRRPGRARIHGAVVCGRFGLRGRAAVDRARDGPLLVGWFGRFCLGAVLRPAGTERHRGLLGVLLALADVGTGGLVCTGRRVTPRLGSTGARIRAWVNSQFSGLHGLELALLTVGSGTVGCWRTRGWARVPEVTHCDLCVAVT